MKKIYLYLLLTIFFGQYEANADYVTDNFFVTEKVLKFEKQLPKGKCSGEITYPVLSNEEEEIIDELNRNIKNFAETYAICNTGKRNYFKVNYKILDVEASDQFSIIWETRKNKKLWRIDGLTFKTDTGRLMDPKQIFNDLSENMLFEIIKLSEGHLSKGASWQDFTTMIDARDIQFYFKDKKWHMVFNSTPTASKVVDVELPSYFMQE